MSSHSDPATRDDFCVREFRSGQPRCPPGRLGGSVQNPKPPCILDVALTEFVRIDLEEIRQLIDCLLRRKRQREIQRRAKPRTLEVFKAGELVIDQRQVRDVVHGAECQRIDALRSDAGPLGGRCAKG